jgi:very-short-patch-repair endonuclease
VFTDVDRSIARIASTQLGLFTRTQAYQAGATPDFALARRSSEAWISLSRQVFRLPSSQVSWRQTLLAAVLNHPDAIIGGRCGAALHGLEGMTQGRAEVVVPFEANARSKLAVVHRSHYFSEMSRGEVDGIAVQSVAECITLAARDMQIADIVRLLDTSLRQRVVTLPELGKVIDRHAQDRLKHIGLLGRLIDERKPDARPVSGTALEQKLDQLLAHPGLPTYDREVRLGLLETGPSIVDRFIPDWGLIIEADGRTWHTRGEDFERDRRRDNGAAAMGYAILRFTWRMLSDDFLKCRRDLLDTGAHRTGRDS